MKRNRLIVIGLLRIAFSVVGALFLAYLYSHSKHQIQPDSNIYTVMVSGSTVKNIH